MDKSFRPWPWRLDGPDETMVVDRNGTEVAAIQGDYDVDWERMFEVTSLIAAAPDLYEALRNIVLLDSEPEPDSLTWSLRGDQAIGAAKAALAKAEGK